MDDFDNLIRHSDFGKILELAGTLKDQKAKLVTLARGQQEPRATSAPSLSTRATKKKKYGLEDPPVGTAFGAGQQDRPSSHAANDTNANLYDDAAEHIRNALVSPPNQGSDPVDVMGRGECLVTDSLIDETIRSLADELKLCLDLKKQLRVSRQGARSAAASSGGGQSLSYDTKQASRAGAAIKTENGGGAKGGLITKFSKWQTDILTSWMIENREHPFPTHDQVRALAKATGLTETQVVNWTTNVRKRNLKSTVEMEKKPHHFLDYLFLATDREKKMRREHPELDFSFLDNATSKGLIGFEGKGLPHPQVKHQHHQPPNIHRRGLTNEHKQSTFQSSSITGHEFSRLNRQHDQQPSAHRRHPRSVAPPLNADQIFRRGKRLSSLKQPGPDFMRAEWPVAHERHQQREREGERMLLQDYAPHGMELTPPGSFDETEMQKVLGSEVFDEGMFDMHNVATGRNILNSLSNNEPNQEDQRNTVSFEMADVPFDENEEDYLMRLISDRN